MSFPKANGKYNGRPRLVYFKNALLLSLGLTVTGGLAGYVVHDLIHDDPTQSLTIFTCSPNGKNMTCYVPVQNTPSIERAATTVTSLTQVPATISSTISASPTSSTSDDRPMWPSSKEGWIFLGAATALGIATIALSSDNGFR